MADSSNPAPPTEEIANLHLDEVTGERISKTELKKRQKARQKEAEKAAKAAAAPPKPASKPKAGAEEKDLNPNQYYEIRSRQVKALLDASATDPTLNPYPHKFEATYDHSKFFEEFGHFKSGESDKSNVIRLAGRIFNIRTSSSKLIFYDLRTAADTRHIGQHIQIVCQAQEATEGGIPFEKQHEALRRGDVIGIVGYPGRTAPKKQLELGKQGELSIFATEVKLLAPCLHMLPTEHYGFKDHDQRFRMRYLDLLFNDSSREVLWKRSKMIRYIRDFFNDRNFLEVETPMMTAIAGGATALPFVTHHNDLNIDMYMRIAPELFLKMLIVGGFEKVFELGKNFRNEGIDLTHNPEFTSCEFYAAYWDVYDVMNITEELVSGIVKHLTGGYKTKFTNQHGETYDVNWEAPWRRIEMIPELERISGEKFPPYDEMHTDATGEFLKGILKKMNVECPPPLTNARMLDRLVGEFIEEQCINPTFIMEHPQMMSPLAKYHRSKKGLCERFEAFVCKKEIANAYTELNNPFDQRLRFEEQARQKAQGDDEAQMVDENFLSSLEYSLPPTGGWGLGIDRLVMFLADKYSIREVQTFPFMKDEKSGASAKFAAEVVGVEPLPEEGIPHK
ncbi:lysyl-tRNA synthetase [Coniochaeta ligniaria NRRL 30616]|uniref:Lysine--tRNA ligase n=1 Tax=Coniochaeta ligniaria NRRL 30616 TaxID=1408157 RepID=A0A1J7ICN2_9PEZI|nr:lysyl-tRNA synthetase [Coniochaeta ligniaria NRRL 30616]